MGPPCLLSSKESACKVRGAGSIPGSGKSPGEGTGNAVIRLPESPWTEEPGGLQPAGSGKSRTDWATRPGQHQ